MSLSEATAFTIFSGLHAAQPEAFRAKEALTPEELAEYDAHVDTFQERAKAISEAAYAELIMITADHRLDLLPTDKQDWTVQDYRNMLNAIDSTEFEQIHLNNAVGQPATKALLALIKP